MARCLDDTLSTEYQVEIRNSRRLKKRACIVLPSQPMQVIDSTYPDMPNTSLTSSFLLTVEYRLVRWEAEMTLWKRQIKKGGRKKTTYSCPWHFWGCSPQPSSHAVVCSLPGDPSRLAACQEDSIACCPFQPSCPCQSIPLRQRLSGPISPKEERQQPLPILVA